MPQPYDHAGDEPTIDEVMADPVIRLLMRRDSVSEAELRCTIRSGRVRLGFERAPVRAAGDGVCCARTVEAGWRNCA
jgi:hypothetical protein